MSRTAIVFWCLVGTQALPVKQNASSPMLDSITELEFEKADEALTSATPTTNHPRRSLLSWSTEYCYLAASGALDNMRSLGCAPEPTTAPACAIGASPTPQSMCNLGTHQRGVDKNRWYDTYAFDRCEQAVVYVSTDETERYYCKGGMRTTGDWSPRRRESAAPHEPESNDDSGWGCWWHSGYEWHDGKCRASKRFLGEACWDDSGECQNGGHEAYSEQHLSCATVPALGITTPKCIPSAFEIERNSCSCNWFDWYLGFACGASECNGHACVWSTGPGGWMCDYNTDNNW